MLKEYKTLLPYLKKYRWYYIFGVLALVATSGGQIIIPQFFRIAVDTILTGTFQLKDIIFLMFQMIGVAVIIAAGRFGWRYFIHGASRKIETELRERLFNHLTELSASFFGRTKVGDLMARASNDMRAIRMSSGMALVAFIDGFFMTLAILIILFSSHPRVALLTIIPLPFVTLWILGLGKLIGERFKMVQEGFSRVSEAAQETFSGIRVIKSFVKEKFFLNKFREINEDYQRRNLSLVRIWGLFFPVVTFLSGLTTLILLRFGGERVILGRLSPGDFVAVLSYLEMLIWPMLGAGFTVNLIQRGAASLGRVNRILEEQPEIINPENPIRTHPKGAIEIRNLDFSYPGNREPVLKDIHLSIPEGCILGILGKTGSGKTSLVNLLLRITDPPRGSIFIDGIDVLDFDLSTLRSSFAYVPQNTFLFSATIEENIAFGMKTPDPEIIRTVSDISTISRDLNDFPMGEKTAVGERGLTLSGGQKQRVAISRALASEHQILLLDDALSAVDTETEEEILKSLLDYRKGKTCILISHRVSTLSTSDKIIVLDRGEIIQEGSHEELVCTQGFYREIFEMQQVERKSSAPGYCEDEI
jgi:ATP-binding cassette subfamily B protein